MAKEMMQTNPVEADVVERRSVLDELVEATRIKVGDPAYPVAKLGLEALLAEVIRRPAAEKVTSAVVDSIIAEIDARMSAQVDVIMHQADFQKMESAWRSLRFLVDRTDFYENNRIYIVDVSKEALLSDFEEIPEITKSGMYKLCYISEYGQYGGQPYGAIIGNYEFTPKQEDMTLIRKMANVSAMTHAPFIAAAGPTFFGVEDFSQLPNLKDLSSIFEMPQFAKWNAFRESEDARYVGLTLPHFLLRLPYGPDTVPAKTFNYKEDVSEGRKSFLWGNTAFAFATRLVESFAQHRWCADVIGPQSGGTVSDLPMYYYESMGAIQAKLPTDILISERKEYELAEHGFIALTMRKNSDAAAFFSANSCQKPAFFGQGREAKQAELNHKLGTQLPYMFIVSRLAHYIKVIQRENIGMWKERSDLEHELNKWINQYVVDMDNPAPSVRSRRPLREAAVEVSEVDGDPGWYRVSLKVRPHFKYMGATFVLSLIGKLDKE